MINAWVQKYKQQQHGFTLVELLIVIVVVAILAAISVVAYNGIQERARDSQRANDIKAIAQALEMYYLDNGRYPNGVGSNIINNSWSTTVDGSWQNLQAALVPEYISRLPSDPASTIGIDPRHGGGYGYAYYSNNSNFCGASARQMYIITYRLEASAQSDILIGECSTNPLSYGSASNYRVVK